MHLGRSEADHSIPVRSQPRISSIVAIQLVGLSINLDYQTRSVAKEIRDVRTDRYLAPKP